MHKFENGSVVEIGNITTSESWTGRKFNGEKIYQKMVTLGSVSIGYTKHNHGISNLKKVVNVYGEITELNGTNRNKIPLTVCDNITAFGVDVLDFATDQFSTLVGTNRNISSMNVCIEYTKTTG